MLLEQLLGHLRVSVEPFALCEIERGCHLDLGEAETVTVHFVLSGAGTIRVGEHVVAITPHCLVLVPRGRRHVLEGIGRAGPDVVVLASELERFRALGTRGEADVVAACGHLVAHYGTGPGLFASLVEPIAVDFAGNPQMETLFAQVLAESASREYGSKQMLGVLMTRCLSMMFHRLCTDGDCALEWLDALNDPRLAGALEDILTKPGDPHSLESLAATALMSRSAFAHSFREAFGTPPMTFLREVRLRKAAVLLRSSSIPVGSVAAQVGYASRAHFSIAFRDHAGMTPHQYRHQGSSQTT